jgi:hypothetical protein
VTTVYAYRQFSGRRANGTTVYGIIPQFDGSRYASTNCGCASEAMRDVSQQKGVRPSKGTPWQPTGARIRSATGDTSGGTNPAQTTAATRAVYGIATAAPRIDAWTNVTGKLWDGYAVDLLVRYGPIDDHLSGSPGFRGNHRIVLVGITNNGGTLRVLSADPLYDGRRAGIPSGQRWIPASVMRRAAGALDLGGGVTINSRYGTGKAYYVPSLTRTTTKKYAVSVPATRLLGQYRVSNGVIVGRDITSTGGFSATCTAPVLYTWPGHGTYKLVRLTSGSRTGKYINAKYAHEV